MSDFTLSLGFAGNNAAGAKGSLTWKPVAKIVDALDEAFYATFQNVEPCGKPVLLALDVSGSMGGGSVAGSCLTPREASAAMALVTAATEAEYHIMGSRIGSSPLNISPRMRLDDVVKRIERPAVRAHGLRPADDLGSRTN